MRGVDPQRKRPALRPAKRLECAVAPSGGGHREATFPNPHVVIKFHYAARSRRGKGHVVDKYDVYRPVLDLIGHTEGTDKGDGYNETLAYGA